jgi:hypothetical protein
VLSGPACRWRGRRRCGQSHPESGDLDSDGYAAICLCVGDCAVKRRKRLQHSTGVEVYSGQVGAGMEVALAERLCKKIIKKPDAVGTMIGNDG